MNRLFARPAASSVWGTVLCLSFACSSEEAPGNVVGVDPSSSAGSSSATGSFNGTSGATSSTGAAASQTSSSGTTSTTTSPSSTSTATNSAATSAAVTSDTMTNGVASSSGQSSQGQNTASDSESVGGASSAGASSGDDVSRTVDDGSTSADSESMTDVSTSAGVTSADGDCSPDPTGDFVTQGDVVLDEKTCLSWMKSDVNGHPYTQADMYCADLNLGGYDDWRLPTAGEATTLFHCEGTFPPVYDVFTAMFDGIWTTTETGTIAGDEPKVCGAGQASGQFYDFGKVGAQNTRCVRGPVTVADRADCKTNNQVCQ